MSHIWSTEESMIFIECGQCRRLPNAHCYIRLYAQLPTLTCHLFKDGTDTNIVCPFKNKRRQALQTRETAIHYRLSIVRLP